MRLPETRAKGRGENVINGSVGRFLRLGAGTAVVGALVLHVGTDPFEAGLRRTTLPAVLAAAAMTFVATVCSAWRWSVVVRRLGLPMTLRRAVAAYYRSQFLNATLPAGVVGDVHRAVTHGHDHDRLGLAIRAVAWDRTIGLVVYAVAAAGVVVVLPSPVRPAPWVATTVILVAAGAVLGALAVRPLAARVAHRRGRCERTVGWRRLGRLVGLVWVVGADGRALLGRGSPRRALLVSSLAAGTAHTAVMLLAARIAGVTTPLSGLVPVAMVILASTAIPVSVAGWGPREVTAAGLFASTGASADLGVTVTVVYGVLSLLATLPGAMLVLLPRLRRSREGLPAARLATATDGGGTDG